MIRLFTDTSANLPLQILRDNDIAVLAFHYTFNGVPAEYSEETDFDGPWFYSLMRNGVEVKTSLVNVGDFTDAFEKELKKGNDCLYVGMSGGISGTANAARIAIDDLKETYPDRKIAAIDTYAASLGEGLQVLDAARMIREGKEFDEIVSELENQKHYMCQYFTVDDLNYLKKGGRISAASAMIGNMLSIKPILTGDPTGHIVLHEKVRGQKSAIKNLAKKFADLGKSKDEPVGIAHADNEEGAKALLEMLREQGYTGDCLTVQYEPVTGSHVGPGALAFFFMGVHK